MKKHLAKKEVRLLISMTCDGELIVMVFRGSRVETIEILHRPSDVLDMPESGEVRYCGFIESKEAGDIANFLQSHGICKYIVEAKDWQKSFMNNFCHEYMRFKRKIGGRSLTE